MSQKYLRDIVGIYSNQAVEHPDLWKRWIEMNREARIELIIEHLHCAEAVQRLDTRVTKNSSRYTLVQD